MKYEPRRRKHSVSVLRARSHFGHLQDLHIKNVIGEADVRCKRFIHSLVFSLRSRAGRNQSSVMWPLWLWHTASWARYWG